MRCPCENEERQMAMVLIVMIALARELLLAIRRIIESSKSRTMAAGGSA